MHKDIQPVVWVAFNTELEQYSIETVLKKRRKGHIEFQ
ncbi:hypothetical protein Bsph_2630 [Lysinibacillus sphaericus C3-41]|uniref:Uncharacterized protein n=1 Tax=Lysinibacillus sphaericus (strain C3-41) TaxID=444177 RepID=B1HYL1_LYSSC|nr:hypothetical protein Bsph_2630 [Lysinibacillus sphaericus C3-41]